MVRVSFSGIKRRIKILTSFSDLTLRFGFSYRALNLVLASLTDLIVDFIQVKVWN